MYKLLFVFAMIVSSVNNFAQDVPAENDIDGELSKIAVGDGRGRTIKGSGYYVVVEKRDEKWAILKVDSVSPKVDQFEGKEILFLSENLNQVDVDYRDYLNNKGREAFDCTSTYIDPKNSRVRHTEKYNPCQSTLTTVIGSPMLSKAVHGVLTLGFTVLAGIKYDEVVVDKGKVLALVKEANILGYLRNLKSEKFLNDYRSDLKRALINNDFDGFIRNYKSNDPDGVIPMIEKRRDAMRLQAYRNAFSSANTAAELSKAIQTYSNWDPENLIGDANERLSTLLLKGRMEKEEAERRAAEYISNWRRSLKIGDDTFCGAVIEIRRPMIKIAVNAPLPGYSSEAWLKIEELFPPEKGCTNRNGRLFPGNG